MQIRDHTFLVSGGSSGLGAACVRMLAGAGGKVLIADVNRPAGEALAVDRVTTVPANRERLHERVVELLVDGERAPTLPEGWQTAVAKVMRKPQILVHDRATHHLRKFDPPK